MATNYNITMRQFNGTDYDTLYPAANLSNSIGKIQASQVEGLSITPDMGDVTGTLAVSHGGTGRTTLTSGYYLVGNGTGQVTLQSPSQLQSSLGLDQYAKIQTGSYTGTGTYGSSNPNSLTFNFKPFQVQIVPYGFSEGNFNNYSFIPSLSKISLSEGFYLSFTINPQRVVTAQSTDGTVNYFINGKWNDSEKMLSFYVQSGDDDTQMNNSGTSYFYVGLGT